MSYLLSAASAVLILALFGVITLILGIGVMAAFDAHKRGLDRVRRHVQTQRAQAIDRHPSGRAL